MALWGDVTWTEEVWALEADGRRAASVAEAQHSVEGFQSSQETFSEMGVIRILIGCK